MLSNSILLHRLVFSEFCVTAKELQNKLQHPLPDCQVSMVSHNDVCNAHENQAGGSGHRWSEHNRVGFIATILIWPFPHSLPLIRLVRTPVLRGFGPSACGFNGQVDIHSGRLPLLAHFSTLLSHSMRFFWFKHLKISLCFWDAV